MSQLHALPTEPLLDEASSESARWSAPPEVRQWLVELATERDPDARALTLWSTMRKQIGQAGFTDMVRGILAAAVRNEYEGAAALTALLGVRASGDLLITRVRSFSSTRRLRQRLRHRHDRNLSGDEKAWLRELTKLLADLASSGTAAVEVTGGAGEIATALRGEFNRIRAKSEAEGFLDPEDLSVLRAVCAVELRALEIRAADLAGSVDPFAATRVARTLPMLAEIDADVRNLGDFLGRMEDGRAGGILAEHVTVMREVLDPDEEKRVRDLLERSTELRLAWRLLRGLDRNPLPQRTLAWFSDRVLAVGQHLREKGYRRRPLDVAACALIVLDHYRDGQVRVPASARVLDVLRESPVEHVDFPDDGMVMVLDRERARRMPLPHGLPLPRLPLVNIDKFAIERQQEVSVKDLVMDNINNTSVLLGLLKNQKVTSTPGIIALIVSRARNMRVLDVICNTRSLHSGHANKDVPLSVLKSPMNIPIKTLRKFVSVRYVSKIELKRLEVDRSAVRREVADEIRAYLKSLA